VLRLQQGEREPPALVRKAKTARLPASQVLHTFVLTRAQAGAGVVIHMLSSTTNPRVKHAIRVRDGAERDLLLAEGERLVEELIRSGLILTQAFHVAQPNERTAAMLAVLHSSLVECFPASDAVMRAISDTVHPQGIVTIARRPEHRSLHDLPLGESTLCIVLDAVQDPGNVGTIIRSAEAAGAAAVIALSGTADAFSPKVLRSAMGSAFRLPVIRCGDMDELFGWAEAAGFVTLAADGEAALTHVNHDWKRRTLLVLGNEAKGVSPALLSRCSVRVRIPMCEPVESLNVASAAAVLMFEAARQRGY